MIEISTRPDRRTLRQFGFIALAGFGVIGGLILWRGGIFGIDLGPGARPTAFVLWGLGVLAAVLSLVAPSANRPLFILLSIVTFPIGLVVSYLVMGLIFYGLLTPIGLLFRLVGRDVLHRRFDRDAGTYWTPAKPAENLRRYFRQF